mgnify:FL=1
MTTELWITIGIITVVCWGMIIWELVNSPVYPDNYINEEETEIRDVPPYEKSPPKSQTYRDVNGKPYTWEYPTSDCQCQVGVKVEKHTKDCEWMEDSTTYQIYHQIREVEKRLIELEYHQTPTSAIKEEQMKLEKKLLILKDSLPSA